MNYLAEPFCKNGLKNEKNYFLCVINCSDPLEGGGTIYSSGFFFLFREFSPLDIFIVES